MSNARTHGIEVTEGTLTGNAVGIVDCVITVQTEWRCPSCRTRWAKRGVHSGHLKTCPNCKARFFLRKRDSDSMVCDGEPDIVDGLAAALDILGDVDEALEELIPSDYGLRGDDD